MLTIFQIQEKLSDALQSDLENGVHWMNNEAWDLFHKAYPRLSEVIQEIFGIENPND